MCGGDCEDLLLVGNQDYLYFCGGCDQHFLGASGSHRRCPKCNNVCDVVRRLGESEKIPSGPCKACREQIAKADKLVEEGGMYWKCNICGARGAYPPDSELSIAVREKSGIKAPDKVGLAYQKEHPCPVCQMKSDGMTNEQIQEEYERVNKEKG
jgi:hypothetical protein